MHEAIVTLPLLRRLRFDEYDTVRHAFYLKMIALVAIFTLIILDAQHATTAFPA